MHSEDEYKGRYADKPHTVLGDNRPLRGWKGELYEGGIRVPALANWPGVLTPGSLTSPVHIVDWMPTLCTLVGYSAEKDLKWDGKDIWPAICGQAADAEPRPLYWKSPNASAIRHGNWKLIVGRQKKDAELYDLAADPYEKTDLASQHPDRVSDLRRHLATVSAQDRER